MRNNTILITTIIAFISIFVSCTESSCGESGSCTSSCFSHNDCGDAVCTIPEEGQEGYCTYNQCNEADCGLGICTYFPFRCKCDSEAVYNEALDDGIGSLGKCVLNYCEQDEDCYPHGVSEAFLNYDRKRLTICGSDNRCHHSCDNPGFPGCINTGEICQDDQCISPGK